MAVYIPECKVDLNGCIPLQTVLQVFDAAIKEERAWAVLYQSAKTCESLLDSNNDQEPLAVVSEPSQLFVHTDGHVHRSSFESAESTRKRTFDESKLINGLGWTLFAALDFGVSDQESRILSPDLDQIIDLMTSAGCEENEDRHCTDDEGIEQDAGDRISFSFIRKRCQQQISSTAAPSQADSHYRAVCRALVAETLEFSQFLSRVTKNPDDWRELRSGTEHSCVELGQLHLSDWARLWLQVMRQLRNGVKLKKTDLTHKPIEYELTPYEMLMEDIRTRRYHLRKVTVDQTIPPQVKKDAHQIILEFIRSRPPLRKASERQLTPRVRKPSAKELLLQSIQSYNPQRLRPTRSFSPALVQSMENQERPKLKRLKPEINMSDLLKDDDDLDDIPDHPPYHDASGFLDSSVSHRERPGLRRHHSLAQLPTCGVDRLSAHRRVSAFGAMESLPNSSGPSSSTSSISSASTPGSPTLPVLSTLMEHMQLGEDFLDPERFNEELNCLSLTLEELVHIRHVLTKAELDSLPLDNALKNDLINNKVCFVCRKTRFGIFGPWGSQCKFCQRTVCKRCSFKMELPSKSFASVPVFSLTPTFPTVPPCKPYCFSGPTSLVNFPTNPAASEEPGYSAPESAPSSPAARRRKEGMSWPKSMYLGDDSRCQVVPDDTPKRPGLKKSLTFLRRDFQNPRPRTECAVCKDCQNLIVRHINYSAREDMQRPCSAASQTNFVSLN